MLTPYQIAARADELDGRTNTMMINRLFRWQDESHLFPINHRFNATERAIKRARHIMSECGSPCEGLEYALTIDSELSAIVNGSI